MQLTPAAQVRNGGLVVCAAICCIVLSLAACGGAKGNHNHKASGNAGGSAGTPPAETTGHVASPAAVKSPQLASNDGPIIVGDHAIIRQGAVGPLRVGEWRRPVMSFVYVVSARTGRDSVAIIVVRGIGKDTVTLAFANDTLRRILVTRPGARTADGIQVGTPFSTIAERPDATVAARGKAKVASLHNLCGVQFATDSAALSPDSIVRRTAPGLATVRAISIDLCAH